MDLKKRATRVAGAAGTGMFAVLLGQGWMLLGAMAIVLAWLSWVISDRERSDNFTIVMRGSLPTDPDILSTTEVGAGTWTDGLPQRARR